MPSIETVDIIPVDLNSLLYHLEMLLADLKEMQEEPEVAANFRHLARQRKNAILKYCWNDQAGYFPDYHQQKGMVQEQLTMAPAYPLFLQIAGKQEGKYTIKAMLD